MATKSGVPWGATRLTSPNGSNSTNKNQPFWGEGWRRFSEYSLLFIVVTKTTAPGSRTPPTKVWAEISDTISGEIGGSILTKPIVH